MLDDEDWWAVAKRDHRADGRFFYAVRTTGVYCRPSCPSRRPRRENVSLFATAAEAESAGYRACRRCDPAGRGPIALRAEIVERACRMLGDQRAGADLASVARAVGYSPFHLHRVFTVATGITPKAYADACRFERVRRSLHDQAAVTTAVFGAGFGSAGRFYASATGRLGMTPSHFRAGAPGSVVRYGVLRCSLGHVLAAATDRGPCAVELGDPGWLVDALGARFHAASLVHDDEFAVLVGRVVEGVDDPWMGTDLAADIRAIVFRERLAHALRRALAVPGAGPTALTPT